MKVPNGTLCLIKINVMKERKKSLKTLLEGDFRPLGERKEGKLRGGFGVLDANGNCGNCTCETNGSCPTNSTCTTNSSCDNNSNCPNCSCTNNSTCPSNSSCPNSGTTTSAPSQPNAFGMMGFF